MRKRRELELLLIYQSMEIDNIKIILNLNKDKMTKVEIDTYLDKLSKAMQTKESLQIELEKLD